MVGFSSPFGGSNDDELFDDYDEFVSEHNPTPEGFLDGHNILVGDEHIAFHQKTKEIFEERGVYDMTFGYNLAQLNLDTRHPNAGYRYAEDRDDPSILRAEFTPTTPFCPQSDTLTKGSFRAWNALDDDHEYDLIRVRVKGMHHQSSEINRTLEELEDRYRETGTIAPKPGSNVQNGGTDNPSSGCSDGEGSTSRGHGPDAPF